MNTRVRYFHQKYILELKYSLGAAISCLQSWLAREPREVTKHRALSSKRSRLRHLLKKYPYWMLGHIRLGMCEFDILRLSNQPLEARSRAAIRLSAAAVRELARDFGIEHPRGRALLEAELLEANLDFINRDLRAAKSRFEELLKDEHLVQVHEDSQRLLLESSAACALILEGQEAADAYLRKIPHPRAR